VGLALGFPVEELIHWVAEKGRVLHKNAGGVSIGLDWKQIVGDGLGCCVAISK